MYIRTGPNMLHRHACRTASTVICNTGGLLKSRTTCSNNNAHFSFSNGKFPYICYRWPLLCTLRHEYHTPFHTNLSCKFNFPPCCAQSMLVCVALTPSQCSQRVLYAMSRTFTTVVAKCETANVKQPKSICVTGTHKPSGATVTAFKHTAI